MAVGLSSIGTSIQVGTSVNAITDFPDEGDITFVDLGCVISSDLGLPETQFFEDKCLGQESRLVKSIPTWNMPGEFTTMHKFSQDTFQQLNTWQEDQKRLNVKLTFPKQLVAATGILQTVADTARFRAYIRTAKTPFPEDGGRVTVEVTYKIDSEIQYTEGTAV